MGDDKDLGTCISTRTKSTEEVEVQEHDDTSRCHDNNHISRSMLDKNLADGAGQIKASKLSACAEQSSKRVLATTEAIRSASVSLTGDSAGRNVEFRVSKDHFRIGKVFGISDSICDQIAWGKDVSGTDKLTNLAFQANAASFAWQT